MRPAAAALILLVLSSSLVPILAGSQGIRVLKTFNCSEPTSKDPEEDPWIAEEWENVTYSSGGQRKILGSGSQWNTYERLTFRAEGQGIAPTVHTDDILKELHRVDMGLIHTNESHGVVLPKGVDKSTDTRNRAEAGRIIAAYLNKPADVKFSVTPTGMLGPQPKESKVAALGACVVSSSVGSRAVSLPITRMNGHSSQLGIRMFFIRMSVCKTYRGKKKATRQRCQTMARLLGAFGCLKDHEFVTCGEKVRSALAGFI